MSRTRLITGAGRRLGRAFTDAVVHLPLGKLAVDLARSTSAWGADALNDGQELALSVEAPR